MSWTCYEARVVDTYGVALVGWPLDSIRKIDNEGSAKLKEILTALQTNTCKWVQADERNDNDVRGISPVPRASRSDKGKKRPRSSKTTKRSSKTSTATPAKRTRSSKEDNPRSTKRARPSKVVMSSESEGDSSSEFDGFDDASSNDSSNDSSSDAE